MSQHDLEILTADANTGPTMRAAINLALQALGSCSSGATAPSTTYAYQLWADTTTGFLKMRNAANSAWIVVTQLAGGGPGSSQAFATGALTGTTGNFTDSTASTSTTTGAVKVAGGVGIAGSVNIGGGIAIVGGISAAGASLTNVNSATADIVCNTGATAVFSGISIANGHYIAMIHDANTTTSYAHAMVVVRSDGAAAGVVNLAKSGAFATTGWSWSGGALYATNDGGALNGRASLLRIR